MCADSVQYVRRHRSGNAQTTEVSAKLKSAVSVRCVSAQYAVSVCTYVTTAETLRGERMCANSGRIWRQRALEAMMIRCSEMRTDETRRDVVTPSAGILSPRADG